jgi:DNA-binding NarL/FixJ family response regulator
MIRVVLVDDQDLVRAGVRTLLEHAEDITVVAEAANGLEGVAAVREHRPDVALVDIRMPVCDGLAATRRIVADPRCDTVKVVVLTTFGEDENVLEAIRAGASGFLLKDCDGDDLRRAVRVASQGDALLDPAVTRQVIALAAASPRPRTGSDLEGLTPRERDVLHQVALGQSNAEVAAALHLSPETARTYVSRLLTKLQARDRSQLVVLAYENGLVTPGAPH